MKNIHILNIGMAKCGTTWLWNQLSKHPDVNIQSLPKEPLWFHDANDLDHYQSHYKNYNVSADFHVNNWQIDQCLIRQLDKVTTHTTVVFSDPYLYIERYYNFMPKTMESNDFVDMVIETSQINYSNIVNRWSNNLTRSKFKIFLYDDLVKDSKKFLSDYFCFCDLKDVEIPDYEKLFNVNLKPKISVFFSAEQIKSINLQIEQFEQMMQLSFAHWKR